MKAVAVAVACAALAAAQAPPRTFPSVFQAWSPADNLPGEDRLTTAARHDLLFNSPEFFGLRWDAAHAGLAERFKPESILNARRMRAELLAKNPRMVLLAEIRYRDAGRAFLPADHKWWKRAADGTLEKGWEEGGFLKLDYTNPEYRKHVAAQAREAVETGVLDGVMLDWWRDDDDHLALIREVRAAMGETALILVNANDRQTPRTAPFVNGYFMECYRSRTAADWERIANTLVWAETALREPRINCLETWFHNSREDLHLMRATTALALTLSDGYCLFSDPNPLPTPDHRHNWYAFWDTRLGRPVAKGAKQPDGSVLREFERGTACYNPFGNQPRSVRFAEARRSTATGVVSTEHAVAAGDGDIFLRIEK